MKAITLTVITITTLIHMTLSVYSQPRDGKTKASVNHAISTLKADSDTTTLFLVTMNDESSFHGRIIESQPSYLKISSVSLGTVTIQTKDIQRIERLNNASIKGGKIWFPNPNATRYFFSPTAIPLKKGRGYYQNIYVGLNSVHVGITDNISLGAGTEIFSLIGSASTGQAPPVFLTAKLAMKTSDKFHIGGGLLYASFFSYRFGIAYGVGTYGSEEHNITLGIGYGIVEEELAEAPIYTISGMTRVSRKVALVTENWITPSKRCDNYDYRTGESTCTQKYRANLTYGLRIMEKNITWDIGFINNSDIVKSLPIGIPYVDFVYSF